MYPLKGHRLMDAWDRGCALSEIERAPELLSIACPSTTAKHWSAAGIPELNLALLQLRQLTFGSNLAGYLPCAACGTRLEFSFDVRDAIEHLESLAARDSADFRTAGRDFSMRRLCTQDLLSIRGVVDDRQASLTLLARCLSKPDEAAAIDSGEIPVECEAMAMQVFSELNEGAEIICRATCVECGRVHHFDLDIARFVWSEVRHHALHLMREVDKLAGAYGWSEEAILAMSRQRRRQYVEMVYA